MAAPIYKKASEKNEVLDREKKASSENEAKESGKAKADSKPEPKKEDAKEEGDKGGGEERSEAPASPHERHMAELGDMAKRHDGEIRDHYNNSREAMRQAHSRHMKERAAMNERQMAEVQQQPGAEAMPQADAGGEPAAE